MKTIIVLIAIQHGMHNSIERIFRCERFLYGIIEGKVMGKNGISI